MRKVIDTIYKNVANLIGWYIVPFSLLSIDRRKIVVSSYRTRGYSDNPKSIIDELLARNSANQYSIFCITEDGNLLPPAVKAVKPRSIAAAYHTRTAKVWIDNFRKPYYVRKRAGQYYMQTWHGACGFKRVEADVVDKLAPVYVKSAINDSKMCDLMISDSTHTTNIYKNSFWYDGDVLTCGSPRTDILINSKGVDVDKIRKKLGVPVGKKTVLYAPTFRSSRQQIDPYNVDFDRLQRSLEKKFGGEWVVLLRLHPNIAMESKRLANSPNIIDVSGHHDPQEVLLVSDALITDYSSIMFDFMFTGRPGFLYANDIEDYVDDRDFYYDISEIPFVLAQNNDELSENIANFNLRSQSKAIDSFFKKLGVVTDGRAAAAAADRVEKWISEGAG